MNKYVIYLNRNEMPGKKVRMLGRSDKTVERQEWRGKSVG